MVVSWGVGLNMALGVQWISTRLDMEEGGGAGADGTCCTPGSASVERRS